MRDDGNEISRNLTFDHHLQGAMADQTDEFTHQIAIKLSRAMVMLNPAISVNPNDLLARNVINLANDNNTVEQFTTGVWPLNTFDSRLTKEYLAVKSFGRFQNSFLFELYSEIRTHTKEETSGVSSQPVPGITVHDSDVLQPERVRAGGLMRAGLVRNNSLVPVFVLTGSQNHTFKKPAKPLEPPTPRTSALGLDRLAVEKRAAVAAEMNDRGGKRPRLDAMDEPHFKGEPSFSLSLASVDLGVQCPASLCVTRMYGNEAPKHLLIQVA